jgi:hypothetical protein
MASVVTISFFSEALAHLVRKTDEIPEPTGSRHGGRLGRALRPVVVAFTDALDTAREVLSGQRGHNRGSNVAGWRVSQRPIRDVTDIVEKLPFHSQLGDRYPAEQLVLCHLPGRSLELLIELWRFTAVDPPAPLLTVNLANELNDATCLAKTQKRHGCGRTRGRVDTQIEHSLALCANSEAVARTLRVQTARGFAFERKELLVRSRRLRRIAPGQKVSAQRGLAWTSVQDRFLSSVHKGIRFRSGVGAALTYERDARDSLGESVDPVNHDRAPWGGSYREKMRRS